MRNPDRLFALATALLFSLGGSCKKAPKPSIHPTTNASAMVVATTRDTTGYDADKGLGYRFRGGMVFDMAYPHSAHRTRKVIFSAVVDNQADLYPPDEASNTTTRLTNTPTWEVCPSFSTSDNWVNVGDALGKVQDIE